LWRKIGLYATSVSGNAAVQLFRRWTGEGDERAKNVQRDFLSGFSRRYLQVVIHLLHSLLEQYKALGL
jgi:hypothetical protein